ncbi:MAG: UDP-glucuronic acid decarboxylase family protein [Ilumatobacteraceae bacterium]
MTSVVAGAAGFIGSHLCDALLASGHDVVGIDNLATGQRANLDAAFANPRFRFVEHDITAPLPELGTVDQIFHLASPASPNDFATMPLEILAVGSEGTRRLLDLAERNSARVLLASTSEVYGEPLVHPQVETYWGNVDPIGPRSCYDEAKRFAEALVTAYHTHRGVDTVIIRIFNTYGPRMRPGDGRVLVNFIDQALRGVPVTVYGDGHQTRSFCFVSDEVRGIVAAMSGGLPGPFNIGNPVEITILELAHAVVRLTGSSSDVVCEPLPPERAGDPSRRRPDISLARRDLAWEPVVELDEGLRVMIDDVRSRLGGTR